MMKNESHKTVPLIRMILLQLERLEKRVERVDRARMKMLKAEMNKEDISLRPSEYVPLLDLLDVLTEMLEGKGGESNVC